MSLPSTSELSGSPPADATSYAIHGVLLRWLRKTREMSIGELARLIGVSESYVTRLERGTSPRVSVSVFRLLRSALGITNADYQLLMADPYGVTSADYRSAVG